MYLSLAAFNERGVNLMQGPQARWQGFAGGGGEVHSARVGATQWLCLIAGVWAVAIFQIKYARMSIFQLIFQGEMKKSYVCRTFLGGAIWGQIIE